MENRVKNILLLILVIASSALTSCGQAGQTATNKIVTFQLEPSTLGVGNFLRLFDDYSSSYDYDTCYNVTPKDITDLYDFRIFKFDTSCSSFLLYENEIYPLGIWFGGYGVTSFAVADLNEDDKFELFFTYSWGSGAHRSLVGYFDSADKEVVPLDFIHWGGDLLLNTDSSGLLYIYHADCNVKSFVDIDLTAENRLAAIVWDSEKITLMEETEQKQ